MTLITRYDPFREFVTLQDRMNRLFRDPRGPEGHDESLTSTAFAPPVDVYEDEHNVTLKIEVPGIEEKDIDVRIENNTLTVHGERKFEKEEKEENFRRVERQYGSFTRSFTLPTTVDPEKVSATYDKGVLKITLAKKAEAKPKQIKVNVGSEKPEEAAQRASSLASEHGNPELMPVHLLAALVEDKEGIVPPVLEKIGIGQQAILHDAYQVIEGLPKVSGSAAQATISNLANQLLELAFKEASNFKDEYVYTDHLLLRVT